MAREIPVQMMSLIAAADLSAAQFKCITIDSNGKAALSGANANAIGVLQNKPTAGQVAGVMVLGETKAIYGAAVTAGNNLMTDASGRLIPATGTNPVVGIALESGTADQIKTVALATRTSSGSNTKSVLSFSVPLAAITATGDVITGYVPGFAGTISKFSSAVTTPTTDTNADISFNLEIGTTNVTGGVLQLTHTDVTPLGNVVNATAITAANAFTASDAISIEATVTQAFTDGQVQFLIVIG